MCNEDATCCTDYIANSSEIGNTVSLWWTNSSIDRNEVTNINILYMVKASMLYCIILVDVKCILITLISRLIIIYKCMHVMYETTNQGGVRLFCHVLHI